MANVSDALLAWYDRSRRTLPWRYSPGERADPYRVWLSEVMLQQTTVKVVGPYFETFLRRWPSVAALAAAPLEAVLEAWAGLGYYSRARNLHACARAIVRDHGGALPETEVALRELPGIGAYTAAAIAAIAYGARTMPVDGNIERVVARLHAVETPLPTARPELRRLARTLLPQTRAGDLAQALMDLGATICTPRQPSCMICPLRAQCAGRRRGTAAALPRRVPRPERSTRRGIAFLALSETGHVLLRQRPAEGLLALMLEVPSTDWGTAPPGSPEALRSAPVRGSWWRVPGLVTHTFTHFRLELEVYRAVVPDGAPLTLFAQPERCRWVHRSALLGQALPSLMRKLVAHGLDGAD